MPGTICSVALCRSNSNVSKKKGESISFFTFPKDEKLRKKWIKKCYRKDKFNPDNKRVCSKHFKIEDFDDVVAAKLKNTVPRRLKCDAIPSMYLLPQHYHAYHIGERTESVEEREIIARKDMIEQLLASSEKEQKIDKTENVQVTGLNIGEENEHDLLQTKYDKLLEENKVLKDAIDKYKLDLLQIASRESMLQERLNNLDKNVIKGVRSALRNVFTKNQLNTILNKHYTVKWTNNEMKKASKLKSISKEGYVFVCKELKYPFPTISHIQRWEDNTLLKKQIDHHVSVLQQKLV